MSKMLSHYEQLAASYHLNRGQFDISELFEEFYNQIDRPASGLLLDLGCGAGDGFPDYFLQQGWQVEGIDFSAKMLELCQQYHPSIKTKQGDLTHLELEEDKYDIIESIYALFHIPNASQLQVLQECHKALKKGGYLYFTYATKEYTGSASYEGEVEFMGSPLYYAHEEPQTLQDTLKEIGYRNIRLTHKTIAGETFLWVSAQK